MKGYKATYNMTCRDVTYEVGKTYTTDHLEICESGYHFCQKQKDTLNYYPHGLEFILLEVEALGEVITEDDKSVTDKIKIIRVIPPEEYDKDFPLHEYDDKGNLTHCKDSNGYEEWKTYDENGNLIHCKDSNGYEFRQTYDENGNLIHCKDSNGYEEWWTYNDKGKLIHCKDSNGYEEWWTYNDKGKLTHFKDSYRFEESYQ